MKLEEIEVAIVIAWALIWSVVAVPLASSASHWLLLVGSGVLPPLVMLRMWRARPRPMVAGIGEAGK
jgi:hypothetical protein